MSPSDATSVPPGPGAAAQVVRVFDAADLHVVAGANVGDAVGGVDAVCPGDIYHLDPAAAPHELVLAMPEAGGGPQRVATGSAVGAPGAQITLLAELTLMAPDGDTVPVMVLTLGTADAATVHAMPVAPLAPRTDYTLLRAEAPRRGARLADYLCLSFLRGTRIARADGSAVRVETLGPGDRLLTRDHGPQPLRWIGHATLRARGQFAPVIIAPGAMGNDGVLGVGQHHRLFLYLRDRPAGLPTAEVLVQARHLVDGVRITLREGGFADFYSLVFDRHEIIYAEGIPVESLMVTEATVARLPEELAAAVRSAVPGLRHRQHFGTEAGRAQAAALRGTEG